jgi:hypothetical protein
MLLLAVSPVIEHAVQFDVPVWLFSHFMGVFLSPWVMLLDRTAVCAHMVGALMLCLEGSVT